MADAVIWLLRDQLGVEAAHFVGHSMGAFVTAKVSDRRDGLVRSFTALDSGFAIHADWFAGLNEHFAALQRGRNDRRCRCERELTALRPCHES